MLRNTRLQRNEYQGIKMNDYGAFGDIHILTTTRLKECTELQQEIIAGLPRARSARGTEPHTEPHTHGIWSTNTAAKRSAHEHKI